MGRRNLLAFLIVTLVKLAWDANVETDLAGYRLRYGTVAGDYTETIDVGIVTYYEVENLEPHRAYYFVVHAYDFTGNESLPSNEVAILDLGVLPKAPEQLKVNRTSD